MTNFFGQFLNPQHLSLFSFTVLDTLKSCILSLHCVFCNETLIAVSAMQLNRENNDRNTAPMKICADI